MEVCTAEQTKTLKRYNVHPGMASDAAFTTGRLFELLPDELHQKYTLQVAKKGRTYTVQYRGPGWINLYKASDVSLPQVLARTLIYLIENQYVTFEREGSFNNE
jgi:lipoate-protein ligase B